MIVELKGTKVFIVDGTLGYQGDNLVNTIQVTVDKDSTWNYKLDMYKGKSKCFDSVLMTREGNVCTVQLTNEILSYGGRYIFQLRGYTDTQTYHSDIFESWVNASIEYQDDCKQTDCGCDCKLPTEFYQVEDNVTEINNHPPYPGDNGKWMIWDVDKHEYVESTIEASGSGTLVVTFTGSSDNIKADHTIDEILQASRDGKDVIGIWNMSGGIYCLPLLAKEGTKVFFNITMGLDAVISQLNIIGTRTSSDDIWELQMSAKDLDTFQTEANLTTSITSSSTDTQYPSAKATYNYGQSIKSLGITSAAVGDIVKVKAVDADGKPTEWEAAELGETWELIKSVSIPEDPTTDTSGITWITTDDNKVIRFQVATDENGNAFSLRKVLIHFYFYSDNSTKSTNLNIALNPSYIVGWGLGHNAIANAIKNDGMGGVFFIECCKGSGQVNILSTGLNGEYGGQNGASMMTPNDQLNGRNNLTADNITKLLFWGDNTTIPIKAGSTMKIWGVRA